MNIKKQAIRVLLIGISISLFQCQPAENTAGDEDSGVDIEALIGQITLEEKVNMIHASSSFTSGGVERLGIPELITSDGPHGVRHEHGRDWAKDEGVYDSSTYLPVGTALAATWNPDLGYKFGTVLGREANYRGKDIILGPGLNIIRDPRNGRNFEYMTEDPYLNSRFVVGYIKGVQEQDVAACAKHYIANSLEFEREKVDVLMSDRAFHEIYLPGFKAAVQEGEVLAIMAAYNKFRGDYCAHSEYLLDDVLRDQLGFTGLVMSDWNAVKSTMGALPVGMDIEFGTDLTMPEAERDYGKFHMGDTVVSLVQSGVVEESVVDAKVRNILGVMNSINKFGGRKSGAYNTPEHQAVAKEIAGESIVLLQNDGVLPINKSDVKKVAVIGANATWKHAGAGGSSQIKAYYEVTPMEGLEALLGEQVQLSYSAGYTISREGGTTPESIQDAVDKAREADVVIYIGGLVHGYSDDWNDNAFDAEVIDKPDMKLPFGQDELIQAITAVNDKVVVALISGGPVDMRPWRSEVEGIVQAWYNGMDGGHALASVLFGEINPSGKLPMTFPEKLDDSPAHALARYPGEDLVIDHKEDIYVGYRYFDTYEVKPAFAFGHGLSYTSFAYSNLNVESNESTVSVSVNIENIGTRSGKEVVQLYVQDSESRLDRPTKELKAFGKIELTAGESKTVDFTLDESAFSYYDDEQGNWVMEPGTFVLHVGSSSSDIRLTSEIEK